MYCTCAVLAGLLPLTILIADYIAAYYQACKGASPLLSGVYGLGMTLAVGPSVTIAGLSVAITKVYRPQLVGGWVILTVSCGALCTVNWDSNLAKPIGITFLSEVGAGMLQAATYFPVLAPLPISENAHALTFFAFCRTFAGVSANS